MLAKPADQKERQGGGQACLYRARFLFGVLSQELGPLRISEEIMEGHKAVVLFDTAIGDKAAQGLNVLELNDQGFSGANGKRQRGSISSQCPSLHDLRRIGNSELSCLVEQVRWLHGRATRTVAVVAAMTSRTHLRNCLEWWKWSATMAAVPVSRSRRPFHRHSITTRPSAFSVAARC